MTADKLSNSGFEIIGSLGEEYMRGMFYIVAPAAIMLQGCATYNFAPPNVEMKYEAEEGHGFNTQCNVGPNTDAEIHHSIAGANALINNFLYAYRCASRQVANGRQHFEVPALLIGLGGVTAAAAGAPAAVAIGTGAATAGLNGAKSYYAPKDKLPILAASVDALVCIKSASVGVDPYGAAVVTQTAKPNGDGNVSKTVPSDADAGTSVAISATDQYYEIIEGALLSVENIAAQRLSSVGSYSPDAVLTEFKALQQQKADADKKQPDQAQEASQQAKAVVSATAQPVVETTPAAATDGTATATVAVAKSDFSVLAPAGTLPRLDSAALKALRDPNNILTVQSGKPKVKSLSADEQKAKGSHEAVTNALLSIKQLQPKINECILRAKL